MSNPSNLYAEKIFAEHPTALWSLDEKSDYLSLITESQRDLSSWQITGGEASLFVLSDEPFPESYTGKITAELPTTTFGQVVCISENITNFSLLNESLSNFAVGAFINSLGPYAISFEIGYEYDDLDLGETVQNLKTYTTSVRNTWFFVSETFDIPNNTSDFRVVVKINYVGGANTTDDYQFLINGINVGQWAEEFHSSSLGVEKISIPSNIAIDSSFGIESAAYGLQDKSAYYLVNDNYLVAKNTAIPLVYGASSLTKLLPNNNKPSLIVPGFGFLSEDGQYKEYTFETWLRINSTSTTRKRIFGPIGSEDGLYVDGPFMGLKINKHYESYYVGEWTRPMLIHLRVSENYASLLVNGEEVISLNYITSQLSFPSRTNQDGKDQDWIGFYAYEDVSPVEIDCVAIYNYQVPILLAKKRFVYGQGVEFPEGINQAFSGSSIFIDYPFADYTNNYSYPNIGNWDQATIDNLVTEDNLLSTPDYSLPEIVLGSGSLDELYQTLYLEQSESDMLFSFDSVDSGYMLFENLNFLNERVRTIYASFKFLETPTNKQTLMRFESQSSFEFFEIATNGTEIEYRLSSLAEPVSKMFFPGIGEIFSVGIDIDKLSSYFGGSVSSFFGNANTLKLYVGGEPNLQETFKGNIYKVGFCTQRNYKKIEQLFSRKGIPIKYENVFNEYLNTPDVEYNSLENYFGTNTAEWDALVDSGGVDSYASEELQKHTASYTLSPTVYFDSYSLDIDIQGYWEDYIPLTYFSQFVKDKKDNEYYDLDFIQFNLNYPSQPIPSTNLLDKSPIKSYVTFQYIENGANLSDFNFTNTQNLSDEYIIEPGSEWINTKYEIVDNTLIYPPKDVNVLDLAIVTHLDINAKGILKNKIKLRSLEYASQAFNDTSSNPIGTRFGNEMYPYTKSGFYYSYKDRNPFTIYKGSSPYLYLTKTSGIALRGTHDPEITRGISIPINKQTATNFKVIAMQAAVRYDKDNFSSDPVEIFEIESKNIHIKFFMQSIHKDGQRAKIYGINAKSGKLENGIAFYWNGKIVREPVITVKEWGFLGISFSNILDFTNRVGAVNLTGPLTFNTISYYQSTNLQEVQRIETRPWFAVNYSLPLTLEWDFWKSSPFLWEEVLIIASTSYYGVDPSTIYKSYTGTNKIIIDTDKVFTLQDYEYNLYKDVLTVEITTNAV
jgi:hypothetical protein